MSRSCKGSLGFAPIFIYLAQDEYGWRHQADHLRKRLHWETACCYLFSRVIGYCFANLMLIRDSGNCEEGDNFEF